MLEAGLGFAVKPQKGDFIGRDAVLRKRDAGLDAPHGAVPAERPGAAALPQRSDRARRQDRRDRDLRQLRPFPRRRDRLGYVPCAGESAEEVLASRYEIEIAGVRHKAVASLKPMYDPKSERVRA